MARLKELLCVFLLVLFIVVLSRNTAVSTKPADQIFTEVKDSAYTKGLEKRSKAQFKKVTGFSQNEFESVVYYGSDSVMEVREVMIVKVGSGDADALVDALKERVKNKAELFRGYAPEQSALLDSCIIEERAGVVFYAVCDDAQKAAAVFKAAV